MSREVPIHYLLGHPVHDPHGRRVGRLEELRVELEQHEHGNDYVVTEFHVGSFGAIETLAGAHFARLLLRRLGKLAPYRNHRIRWDRMDLTDPHHLRTLDTVEALEAAGGHRD